MELNYQLYMGNDILIKKIIKKEYINQPNIQKILYEKILKYRKNWEFIFSDLQKKIDDITKFVDSDCGYYRSNNEDKHILKKIITNIYGLKHIGLLFGIFDGHGGSSCSEYCAAFFSEIFNIKLEKTKNIKTAFYKTVYELNKRFLDHTETNAGSCLCMNYLYFDIFRNCWILTTCNVGDSRTVINENNNPIIITKDHKPNTDIDIIKKNNGFISNNRLNGTLAVSRALGNKLYVNKGISSYPDIFINTIKSDAEIIVACDGVWDVIPASDLAIYFQIGRANGLSNSKLNISKLINEEAIRRKSKDNVSNIYLRIKN